MFVRDLLSMAKRPFGRLLVLAAVAILGLEPAAQAALQVRVDQGVTEPIPIAIPDFIASPEGRDIASVVRADLERSGLFRSVNPASFIETDHPTSTCRRASAIGAPSRPRGS